jgi:hypothetical protein
MEFCQMTSRWTKKWERILFTDESWLCAEPYDLRYVRRFAGEELSEENCIKKTKFNGKKKILVWAAISYDEPEQLYFSWRKQKTEKSTRRFLMSAYLISQDFTVGSLFFNKIMLLCTPL